MSIEDYSIEQLEEELNRKRVELKKKQAPQLRAMSELKSEFNGFAIHIHDWYTLHVARHKCPPKNGDHYVGLTRTRIIKMAISFVLMISAVVLLILHFVWKSLIGRTVVSFGWTAWAVAQVAIAEEVDAFYYLFCFFIVFWGISLAIHSALLMKGKEEQ